MVWQPDESRHTSAYIDHPGWKRAITEAGEHALGPLMEGPWTADRWSDLLKAAATFATSSGLEAESERAELLSSVRSALVDAGLDGAWTCRLCMLGVSAVVAPLNPAQASPDDVERLRVPLHALGLEASLCGLAVPGSEEE